MAIVNRIDPDAATRSLADWFATKYPESEDIAVTGLTIPSTNGRSSETLLFDASWTRNGEPASAALVARVEPEGEKVVYSYDLEAEYRVMKALGENTDVPVPKVYFYEDDTSVLGNAFILMERIEGRTPGDEPPFPVDPSSWIGELEPRERARLFDNALGALADIHAVDWQALGLDSLDRPELGATPTDQCLAYWERFAEWAMDGESNPTVDATIQWLESHRPSDPGPTVMNWGDSRLGNLMFSDDMSVAAVLDWELACVGTPGIDLGWWLFSDRHHSVGMGGEWPSGFPSREETIDRYVELSGNTIVDAEWHEAFGGLRFAALMARAGTMLVKIGALPPGHSMAVNNPATQLLSQMLDVPAPEGEATSFLG